MSQPALKKYITPEEYLAMEEAAEYRSEYYQGEIFAMAGATSNHNLIAGEVYTQMNLAFKGKDCVAYIIDVRLWIKANGLFTYPDLMVVCGKTEFYENRKDTITNPALVVEVLSEATKDYDRGTKFMLYRSIPTLREYLIIHQKQIHIEQFSLDEKGRWFLREYNDPNAILHCASVDFQIPLREIYTKVEFENK
jgi:Uma2 family endonuclease